MFYRGSLAVSDQGLRREGGRTGQPGGRRDYCVRPCGGSCPAESQAVALGRAVGEQLAWAATSGCGRACSYFLVDGCPVRVGAHPMGAGAWLASLGGSIGRSYHAAGPCPMRQPASADTGLARRGPRARLQHVPTWGCSGSRESPKASRGAVDGKSHAPNLASSPHRNGPVDSAGSESRISASPRKQSISWLVILGHCFRRPAARSAGNSDCARGLAA